MKKILITGADSYIGTSFENYIKENHGDCYEVDTVDMTDEAWKEKNFGGYDCVFHVAGIAHQKETQENAPFYYEVNCNLAVEAAEKARNDGVSQFIFLSSMSVYGKDTGVITEKTSPAPASNYGRSKLMAEEGIERLSDDHFRVCILRPPMVYGKGCKGNFVKIKRLVEISPVFPRVRNERSMIYIENLVCFVKKCIDENLCGVFFPQNSEYMSTAELARGIAEGLGKRLYFDPFSGLLVKLLSLFHPVAKKAFGSLIYRIDDDKSYCAVSKEESLRRSAG